MDKKVKCKKCHLTYNKKEYECPYCHTKRFNPTGLIIALIIIIAAIGTIFYFKGSDIIESFNNGTDTSHTEIKVDTAAPVERNEKGIIFDNLNVSKNSESYKYNYEISFDITNNTTETQEIDYILLIYIDEYKSEIFSGNNIFSSSSGYINEKITSQKKIKESYNIQIDDPWQKVEIFIEDNQKNAVKVLEYTNPDTVQ